MALDLQFFLFAIPAVLFAAVSKGGFANGVAFASAPFLALILEPAAAVALMLPLLMLMDLAALRAFWRKWDWAPAKAMILGAIPGILLGALIFGMVDADMFRLFIGLVAILFVAFQAAKKLGFIPTADAPLSPRAGKVAGFVAGFTSFISHAGGPPAAVYMLSLKMDKTTFQATATITFFVINMLKLPPYWALGMFNADLLKGVAVLAPIAIGGVYLGVFLHHRVSDRLYFAFTYIFLTLTGAKLIFDALT